MDDKDSKIKELENNLSSLQEQMKEILNEQQSSARLLIRRDLALSRANEQLQALDEAKSEFISVAAHQLRTPLSAIKWILHMLANNEFKNDVERLEFTDKALKSTDRMIGLVNDLLEVDHIQSGKDQFVFVPVDIIVLLNSIITEFKSIADSKDIYIDIELKSTQMLYGDMVKLRALFQNLLENAIKYTGVGGSVKIKSFDIGNNVQIEISDSGIGIPENQKSQIFSKFFRAQNAMKQETVGSGLGLFIAKQVVERHGGTLKFESTLGVGTTFIVVLPSTVTTNKNAN